MNIKSRSESRTIRKADSLIEKIKTDQSRYKQLINIAKEAMSAHKVYTVCGKFATIKNALESRGWIQKLEPNQSDNLKKHAIAIASDENDSLKKIILSELTHKHCANFVWDKRDVKFEDFNDNNQLYNRIQMNNFTFTTKDGLCEATRDWHWYYVEGVSKVNIPRSYDAFIKSDLDDFVYDYKITSCTNMLKWLVDNENAEMFSKHGKIPQSVITFALDQCSTYIEFKEHKDINWTQIKTSDNDWNKFLAYSHKLMNKIDHFANTNYNIMKYINNAIIMIDKIRKYNHLMDCEGYSNVWIIKPACLSRGRGITLESNLESIIEIVNYPHRCKYIIQKYIEKPLLIYNTKFDIRQYFMITNTYPLTLWMYKDCYLRFSSQEYRLDNFHESIHLTNNSIQYKYENCDARNENLPACNMWSLDEFKNYLNKIVNVDVWSDIIYSEMRKNIIGVMLCCQSGMRHNNNFQLYGCDFVLDESFKPWLLEINSSPALTSTTEVTSKVCNDVLEDLVKVVVDRRGDAEAATGNFECIYKQQITKTLHSYDIGNLTVYGKKIKKRTALNNIHKKNIIINTAVNKFNKI